MTLITNNSRANQGVWTDGGLVFVEPGQTLDLAIKEGHEERTRRLPFLAFAEAEPDNTGPATADEIGSAIDLLDKANDDHWTAAGLPAVDAVAELLGKPVTRAAITAAAPDAKRPTE